MPQSKKMGQIRNIIFDFGGVIADISRDNAVSYFRSVGLTDAENILDKYHQKGIFLEIEDGRITPQEFCEKLGEMCHRTFTFEEAKEAWLAFFTAVPPYRLDLLLELKKKYRLYLLSNTNPFVMSWARSSEFTPAGKPLDDYMDKIYTSYEIGYTKPAREIFEFLIRDTRLIPQETLFVDDGASNIAMGKKLGLHTFQPQNGEDWREGLEAALHP